MIDYHRRHARYADAGWHRRFLRSAYRRSYEILEDLGCHPLDRPHARVLLCGAGAPATAQELGAFVRARQPSARLVVADRSQVPLVATRAGSEDGLTFVRCDARRLPFTSGSFDLVETDFLLQFLAPDDRQAVIREWARILRPGGGLTSRDWVRGSRLADPAWDVLRRAVLRIVLDARTYVLTGGELRLALRDAGFRASVVPLARYPLIHVIAAVAQRPEGE